jgi:hypothetical protein
VLSLQGYETEIDANGWELDVGTIPTTQYFSIYYEVNLATQATDIKSTYDTAGYPVISSGDDLSANITGTARLLLYRVRANNGVISVVNKMVLPIQYTKDLKDDLLNGSVTVKNATNAENVTSKIGGVDLDDIFESDGKKVKNASLADAAVSASSATNATQATTQAQSDNSTKIATTAYVRTAISNFYGSTTLGFTPTLPVVANIIKRQGNLVILEFAADTGTATQLARHTYTFTIPQYTSNGLALRPTNSVPLYYATRTSAIIGDLPTYGTAYKQHIGTNGVFTHTIDSAHYAWGIRFFCAYERT